MVCFQKLSSKLVQYFFRTHTTGYKRSVSGCQRRGKSTGFIVAIKGVPLMKALKYFMSRMSSNVGFLEKPTFSRISSRKRSVVFGYIANRYIENVRVEAVCQYTAETWYYRTLMKDLNLQCLYPQA